MRIVAETFVNLNVIEQTQGNLASMAWDVASIAWGVRNLISTQAGAAYR